MTLCLIYKVIHIMASHLHSVSSQYSSSIVFWSLHCSLSILDTLLPQDLCTCSLSWNSLPLDTYKAGSLISFWSVFRCHFLSEIFPGHPV